MVQAEYDRWIKFSFGFALGAIVEYTANYDGNTCLNSIATLLESSYLIYFYLSAYQVSKDNQDVSYAMLYLLKAFDSGFGVNCGTASPFEEFQFNNLKTNDSAALQSIQDRLNAYMTENINNRIVVRQDADPQTIYNVFDFLYRVVGELDEIIGLIEVVLDIYTIYGEWNDGDYFEAGLFTGKGIVNAYFTIDGLITRYQ